MSKEFFTCDGDVYCIEDGKSRKITERDTELIDVLLGKIRDFYPEADKSLRKAYEKSSLNVPYYKWLMATRFIRCNFGTLDTTDADITDDGVFRFEKVKCPLRGECPLENVVCMPKFNTKLSEAENRVMKLYFENPRIEEIAEVLYLSGHTVKNHIKAAYAKLGIHSRSEFISYANKNHLYD